jgi:hypothetical protein
MDIERLTKVQIVLLTLLISFVTSIATGIVTVSLMDQAPPSVAETVNRVIERTVQTVVPSGQSAATVVTQEKTVVVKESDLIAQAVDKVSPSVVRLFTSDPQSPQFLGLGVILDASGTVATDVATLGESADAVEVLSDGSRVRAFVHSRDDGSGVALLASATSTQDGKPPAWTPVMLSSVHATLGETVVVLAGNTVARIQDGIVTAIHPAQSGSPQVIDTGIAEQDIMFGSPLIDTDGALVGVSTSVSRASSASGFVPSSVLAGKSAADEKK